MDNIVKRTSRFDINIDARTNRILIIQRWKYNWISNGFSDWNYIEKKKMHEAFEKEMIHVWNESAYLKPTGRSAFANKYKLSSFRVSFDIQWATSFAHWEVEVRKVAPNNYEKRPFVKWLEQKIFLYNVDVDEIPKQYKPTLITQKNIAHEFGHTLGNTSGIPNMHSDEYKPNSPFYNDKQSLMNKGMELRGRHFDYIIREINTMIPDTQFILSL